MMTLTTSIDVLDLSDGTVTRSQEGQRTITTTDAAELPLLTLDPVYGECVQDGTPAPDAPVPIKAVRPNDSSHPNKLAVVCSNGNTAYIDMTDKETGDPVELYGFDDAHRDILRVDSTGHVTVEKKVHKLYFDGSDMAGWSVLGNYVSTGGGLWQYTVGDKTYTENADVMDKALCAISDRAVSKGFGVSQDQTGEFYIMKTGLGGNTLRFRPLDNGGVAQTVAQLQTWLQTHPTTILWQDPAYDYTIDLGYVDLPVVEDESVVHIVAEVQPVIGGTWWTHAGKQAGLAHQKALLYSREGLASYESLMSTFGTVTSISGGTVTVSADDGFELQDGKTLFVHANGYTMNYVGAVSINVNGTGAQPLYVDSANAVSSSDRVLWGKDALMLLRYAQGKWTIADAPNRIYAYSTTAGSTAAKALTLGKGDKSSASGYDYVILRNTTLSCRFTNANTAASATLNLEGGGAVNITAGGSALDGLYNWYGEDTVEFVFTGTQWAMMGNSASRIVTDYGTSMFVHPKGNMSQGMRIGVYEADENQTAIQVIYNSVLRAVYGTEIKLFGNASGGSPKNTTYPYAQIASDAITLWADGSTRTRITGQGVWNYYTSTQYTAMKSDGFYAYASSTYFSRMCASSFRIHAGNATYPAFEVLPDEIVLGQYKTGQLSVRTDGLRFYNTDNNIYNAYVQASYGVTLSFDQDNTPMKKQVYHVGGALSLGYDYGLNIGSDWFFCGMTGGVTSNTYANNILYTGVYANTSNDSQYSSYGFSALFSGAFYQMEFPLYSKQVIMSRADFSQCYIKMDAYSELYASQHPILQLGVEYLKTDYQKRSVLYMTKDSASLSGESYVMINGGNNGLALYSNNVVDVDQPAAWRTALGLNVVTTKPTITAASGITIYSSYFERQGNVVCFMISFYYSSAISVPANGNIANIQVATVATGYRPVHEIGLQSHGDDAGQAWGRFNTNGVIYLGAFEGTGSARTVTLSSTTRVTFYGTYMAA